MVWSLCCRASWKACAKEAFLVTLRFNPNWTIVWAICERCLSLSWSAIRKASLWSLVTSPR